MVYAALLRGINVGGNNKINMKELKTTFQRVGLNQVTTYINSGNVIFSDEHRSKAELSELLEKAIAEDFGLTIRVLIRSLNDLEVVMKELPDEWTNDDQMKSDVLFLWDEVDERNVSDLLPERTEFDEVRFAPGAVLWSVARKNVTKSRLVRIVGTPFYKQVTVRNVNTTRTIYRIMQETAQAENN